MTATWLATGSGIEYEPVARLLDSPFSESHLLKLKSYYGWNIFAQISNHGPLQISEVVHAVMVAFFSCVLSILGEISDSRSNPAILITLSSNKKRIKQLFNWKLNCFYLGTVSRENTFFLINYKTKTFKRSTVQLQLSFNLPTYLI